MKTRITEVFGIKHPIMLAGMNWLTTPELVSAVSNAGGLGNLAISAHTPENLRSDRGDYDIVENDGSIVSAELECHPLEI